MPPKKAIKFKVVKTSGFPTLETLLKNEDSAFEMEETLQNLEMIYNTNIRLSEDYSGILTDKEEKLWTDEFDEKTLDQIKPSQRKKALEINNKIMQGAKRLAMNEAKELYQEFKDKTKGKSGTMTQIAKDFNNFAMSTNRLKKLKL